MSKAPAEPLAVASPPALLQALEYPVGLLAADAALFDGLLDGLAYSFLFITFTSPPSTSRL